MIASYRTSTCDLGIIQWLSPDGNSTYGRIFNEEKGIVTMSAVKVEEGVYNIAVEDRRNGKMIVHFNGVHGTLDNAINVCELLAELNLPEEKK